MNPERTSELLHRRAREAGFDRAGVARLAGLPDGRPYLEWLADGYGAGMAYLERRVEKRLDCRVLVPGARSVVCVAVQYAGGEQGGAEPEGDLWPRVARYARGRDYHAIMSDRLSVLAELVERDHPGCRCRWYVDTGPVLERDLAAAAGLGVVGKNTNLLHPEAGSYFFLGEMFTSLEVEPEPRVEDLCGQCSRCLEACPTGALPEPFRLNAERCISYWTIEHRGPVPAEMRPLLGDWVFGCDVCQEVCPLNQADLPAPDPQLALGGERAGLRLAGLLELDEAAYQRMFRGSAMKRAKRSGLRRNAAIAMGNLARPEYVEPLARVLRDDDDETVRGHAAWALGQIGGSDARHGLEKGSRTGTDRTVRAEIDRALRRIGLSS